MSGSPEHPSAYIRPDLVESAPEALVWAYRSPAEVLEAAGRGAVSELVGLVRPQRDLALRFANLADAADDDILRFARRYGVLAHCMHGLPCTHLAHASRFGLFVWPHDYPCPAMGARLPASGETRLGPNAVWGGDFLAIWRYWARRARATLLVASGVYSGDPISDETWDHACCGLPQFPQRDSSYDAILRVSPPSKSSKIPLLDQQCAALTVCLRIWMELGNVRPQVGITPQRPWLHLASRSLFGAVALQLTTIATRAGAIAICTFCGDVYLPKRRPRSDGSADCGKRECQKAHWRSNQWRKRHGQAKPRKRASKSRTSKRESSP